MHRPDGESSPRTPRLAADAACQQEAQAGVSIGLESTESGTGTLGSFVELHFQDDGKWEKFGITCFHCVYPRSRWKLSDEQNAGMSPFSPPFSFPWICAKLYQYFGNGYKTL